MRPFRSRPHASLRRLVLVALSMGTLVAAAVGASAVLGIGGAWTSNQRAAVGDIVSPYQQHLLGHNKVPSKLVAKLDKQRAARCARPAYLKSHAAYCPTVWASLSKGKVKGRSLPAKLARRIKREAALAPADQIGRWGAPFDIPQLDIHSILLPTGKVLMFAYPDSTHTLNEASAWVWDPTTGATKQVNPPTNPATGRPYNIWCGGHTLLPDGRVVVAGGNLEYAASPTSVGWKGLNVVLTFNPFNETWTQQPNMRGGRWYPTLTTLPDGRVVIFSGLDASGNNTVNNDLEVFTPSPDMNGVGTVTYQPTATHTSSIYPHMAVLPSGKVLMAGPDTEAALLNPATWTWQDLPNLPSARNWGSAAILPAPPGAPQKLMIMGGVADGQFSAQNSTVTIDLNNPAAGWTTGPPMKIARAHLNTVILPDNSILAVGGGAGQDPVDGNLYVGPVYQSEILSPTANTWSLADTQAEERTYHSTALLLPDGRVFSAGDDRPGHQFTDKGELYSPPYLFKGPRPVIEFAPTTVNYNAPFRIAVDYPQTITSVRLMALGSDTHANDMNQRSIGLALTNQADGVTLTSPLNANIAPPGYYMLYAVNAQGVPSASKIIKLDPAAPAAPPLPGGAQPPSASFTVNPVSPAPGQVVTLTDTSTDPDGTIASRAWDIDNDGLFDDGTGATATASFPVAGTYTVRLQVTDNSGLSSVTTASVYVTADPTAGIQPPAGNLVSNSTFENSTNGWGAYQSALDRVALADAPNGGYVAKVSYATGTYYTIDDDPETVLSATAGTAYTFTAYLKAASPSAVGKPARVVIRERTAGGAAVGESSSAAVALTNTFQAVTVTRTAATTGNVVDLYIQQDNAVAGDAFYVDMATLVPTAPGGGGGTVAVPAGNLTTNPSFETNTAGWGIYQATLARVAQADSPNGGFAAQVSQAAGTFYTIDDTPDTVLSTTTGTSYLGTAYVKAASASAVGKPVRVVVREWTPAGAFVNETSSAPVNLTNAFQPISVTGVAQTTGDHIDMYVQQDNAVAGDSFYTDLLSLVPTAPPAGGGGTVAVPTGNLTTNPSFETNTAGWGIYQATLARVAQADSPNGNFASKVTRSAGTFYTIDDTPDTVLSTTAGTAYSGSAYVKAGATSSVGKPVRIVIREWTPAGAMVKETSSAAVNLTNAFQPITVTGFTAQTTGDHVDLYIQQDNAVAGDAFYADVISLVPTAGGGGGGTVAVPAGNLTTNPSFETNTAGWGIYQATLARVAQADSPNGGFAAQVSQAAGTFYTIDDTPDTVLSTTTGTSYLGTAYVKAASASAVGKPVRVVVREWTPAGAFVNETSSAPVNLTNAFQPISVTGVAQTTGDHIDMYVQQDNAVAGDSFYTDLLSLVPTAPPAGGGGTVAVPTGNLTTNPSFETNTAGWGIYQATLARVAQADSPNGNFASKVTRSAGTFYTIDDTPDTVLSTTAGTAYSGSAYVKAGATSSVGKPVRIVIREWTPAGAMVKETSSAAVNLTNAFQPITVTGFTAQTTGDHVDLYIQQDNAVAGDAFYADVISLVPTAGGGGGGTVAVPAGNLTTNPSLETNATGWAGLTATVARAAQADAPNGSFALTATRSSGTTFGFEDNPDTVTASAANAQYQGSAYVKSTVAGSTGKVVTLTVQQRTAGGTVTKTATANVTLTAAFQKVTVTLTTTATAGQHIDVRLTQAGAAAGNAFAADLISLVRLA